MVTLLAVFLLLLGAEIGSRVAMIRVSRIEGRTAGEFKAAEALRKGAKPHVLLAGNSLLLEGVDLPRVTGDAGSYCDLGRYVIENTRYFDWYYGVRRLLADGSRPDLLILFLSPLNLINQQIRGEYSAYYMFRAADIPDIKRTLGLGMTDTSNLVFAHYSFFYASRNNLRNVVLNRSFPAYGDFLHNLPASPENWPASDVMRPVMEQRLRALNAECRRYQVAFGFVVPPSIKKNGEAELLEAAASAGTRVAIPIRGGVFDASMFRDGYHLNERGAALFTRALEEQVKQWVNDLPAH